MHYSIVTMIAIGMVVGMGGLGFAADATNRHRTLPGQNSSFYDDNATFLQFEDADRAKDAGLAGFVFNGGTHATAAGMTSAAFATQGYTLDGLYVNQTAAAINYTTQGCAASDTAWVILDSGVTGNLGNFTRVVGTHYLVDCASSARPALPSTGAWLMGVTLTGGAIAIVGDLRTTSPIPSAVSARYGELPYLVSGCTPTVPVATLTFTAFACAGYIVNTTGELQYVNQAAVTLGPLTGGDGVYWLALYADTYTTVTDWTHQVGTSYIWTKSATVPTMPSKSVLFGKVTVAGGIITAVNDKRFLTPGETKTGIMLPALRMVGGIGMREALQRTHDACDENLAGGCAMYVPPGVYSLDATPLSIRRPMTLRGAGRRQTYFSTSDANATAFDIVTTLPVTLADFTIASSVVRYGAAITVKGNSAETLANEASVFRDLSIETHGACIQFVAAAYWTMHNVYCRYTTQGVSIANTAAADAGDHVISNSVFVADGTNVNAKGIHWETSGGLKITATKVLGANAAGIELISTGATGAMQMTGNSIENFTNTGILVSQASGGSLTGFVIANNELAAGGNAANGIVVSSTVQNQVNAGTINGNVIQMGLTGNGILLDKVALVTVSSNTVTSAGVTGAAGNGILVTGVSGLNTVLTNSLEGGFANTFGNTDATTLYMNPSSSGMTLAQLNAAAARNGSQTHCTECLLSPTPMGICVGGGNGNQAFRIAGVWRCL